VVSSAKAAALLGYAPSRTIFDILDEALDHTPATAGRDR
jgi:hypothetical protein